MDLTQLQLAALEHVYHTGLGYVAFDYTRLPFTEYFDLYVREFVFVNEVGGVAVTDAGYAELRKAELA